MDKLTIGDKVCFVDLDRVPVTPESGAGCLKVVGFDDGYADNEYWAVVARCDDRDFVWAGGKIGSTTYVATWFENLRRCEEEAQPVPPEVAEKLNELVRGINELGYDVDVQFL